MTSRFYESRTFVGPFNGPLDLWINYSFWSFPTFTIFKRDLSNLAIFKFCHGDILHGVAVWAHFCIVCRNITNQKFSQAFWASKISGSGFRLVAGSLGPRVSGGWRLSLFMEGDRVSSSFQGCGEAYGLCPKSGARRVRAFWRLSCWEASVALYLWFRFQA